MRITDTGLSYLSTMSSLRSLYLRWCCQVGVEHGCARPGLAQQRGHGGTSLGRDHELRVGSQGWLKTPRLGARKQRAPVSSAGLSPGTLTLHPCPSTSTPDPVPCCSTRLPALPPCSPLHKPDSVPQPCTQNPAPASRCNILHPAQAPLPSTLPHHSSHPQHPEPAHYPSPGTPFPIPAGQC